jgi:hypothetical protein
MIAGQAIVMGYATAFFTLPSIVEKTKSRKSAITPLKIMPGSLPEHERL